MGEAGITWLAEPSFSKVSANADNRIAVCRGPYSLFQQFSALSSASTAEVD
jgi:hypothetical protein